ncbi:hypothetical protein QYE76_042019 [Lolium multiflorum]|uniref:Protein FAR1-RELATED SEQUENCE n=1 Tax=Lolium multiflorum TaxID=4521 RepID=A0AAD8TEW2_LOLMU|nr:hypothetical protein QYE76_042019 [Lolium multiflorum]
MEDPSQEEDKQDQEDGLPGSDPLLTQANFSYMGLLRGDLDTTYSPFSDSMKRVSQTLTSVSHGQHGNDTSMKSRKVHSDSEHHELKAKQHREHQGSSSYENMNESSLQQNSNGHGDIQDNPWNADIFQDIILDEIIEDNNEGNESNHQEFDHTWNLDAENDRMNAESSPTEDEDDSEKINEEDVDNFWENEKQGTEQLETELSADLKLVKGMEFKSREDAQKYLNMYSFAAGFSIAIVSSYRTTSKKRNNEVIRVTIKCNKHGHNTDADTECAVQQRQSTVVARTDCKVEMVISERGSLWIITNLFLDHNHPLEPGGRFFRSHVLMTKEEKSIIRTMKQCNIPTRNIVSVLAHMRGGMEQLPYNKRKVCNYGTSVNREVNNNDLQEVLEWFNKKQAENPGFYYTMEIDAENKVRSVFWTDARSRQYYDLYGDCVSFDTTFLTNKYNLPFAPFVGISPHGKTYLFACAFIINETANTFEWLFRMFLLAMCGKPPQSIMTDQDQGMATAIKTVFPKATHRSCLFHVKKM